MAPFFAAMADIGEQEIIEDDVPFLQLTSKKIKRDAQGFGKHRGGMGYEIAVAARGTPLWGFATVSSGSKFPAVPGVFGEDGCPTYPLAKVKGANVFDHLRDDPAAWSFDYETIMNSRPFPEARYSTHHMGMGFELADEGEVYMICQGSGGGYGDVLERDPEAVVADVAAGYLSHQIAHEIYFVVYDEQNLDGLLLDEGPTAEADLAPPQAHQPVLNLAAHYEWPVFVRTDAAQAWPHGPVPGLAGWIGSAPPRQPDGRWGLVADEDAWADTDGDLLLARVPADGDPETIMRKVRELR
jgi:hypothetical protein